MVRIRICDEPEACGQFWQKLWPQTCFFDLWPVRQIFAESFSRAPYFLIAEQQDRPVGMLALCRIEGQRFAHFPGELWQSKTWIEQNRIPVREQWMRDELLASLPGPTHLRYLTPESMPLSHASAFAVDEENFRIFPRLHGYSFERYMQEFSHKSQKNLSRERAGLEASGIRYRYDNFADIQHLLDLNLAAYGDFSYFADSRFLQAFVGLFRWLSEKNMLRITTLLIGGEVAAVDAGAVWNSQYTVLAGGTSGEFPGVAKIINFHHIAWACAERLEVVDFLCGDFGWKKRFHLQPCPLYQLHIHPEGAGAANDPLCCLRGFSGEK